jgi:glycosyltransferase involved in cell wall biosynthesis
MTPSVADVLRLIPLSTRVLLDVGCGRGELGMRFRPLSPTTRLLGLATDAEAAGEAVNHLDEVAVPDLDQDDLPFDVSEGIDCIVYRDVLERVLDPWAMIRRHARSLTPNGVMILCVPNLAHWQFADRLLRGTFDHAQDGMLDLAHLRWFSLDGMRRGLEESGLVLCDVQPHGRDAEGVQAFVAAMAPGLAALGIDPDAYARRASPRAHVWRVRKEPQQRLTIAGSMLPPIGGVSHLRVVYPLQAMATDPLVTAVLTDRADTVHPNDDSARVAVLHRPALTGPAGVAWLRRLMDAGWVVVTEFDDHPDFFSIMQQGADLSFRGVHAIQTSTPMLAEVLRRYNPEVAIFPNAMSSLPPVRNFADPRALTFFFGALNREEDWQPLMPAINAVAAKAGERLKFQVVHDHAFFEALETPHKNFTPICDHDTYLSLLGQAEISFMPLGDTGFNRAKSDLKFIEAGACRVASVASTIVYGASIADGQTGLLFRDARELQVKLLRLVAMPELARGIGDNARQYVARERMMAYQVAPRLAWYRSLWARRDALTAALQERLAGSLATAA